MKRLTIFLILTFGILCARAQESADSAAQPAPVVQPAAEASPEQLWDRANTAYINGDFHTATEVYEQILSRGLTSVKLYYNLANSYFKEGQLGKSVLFYRRALRMLELARSTRQELADVKGGAAGTLRLGTVSSSAPSLLSGRINRFHARYPQVRFELHEGNTFELIEMLHTGIIDLAIVRTPFKAEGTGQLLLPPEPMVVALRGPLAESGQVPVRWLKSKPLIFYRRFEGLIQTVCRQEGFEPEAFCVNDDARTCLMWAQAGLGAAVAPYSAAKLMAGDELRLLTLEHPDLYTSIAAIWKKDGYLSAAAQRFLEAFAGQ